MNLKHHKPATPWTLIMLFFIVSALSVAAGLFYYRYQKEESLKNTSKELSTISDLKIRQIIDWRRERLSDGNFLRQNITMIRRFRDYLDSPDSKLLKDDLLITMKSLVENYDYRNALFLDRKCKVRLFYPAADTVIGELLSESLPDYLKNGEVVLTDLHKADRISFVHLDLIIPLNIPGESEGFGMIVLRIDPEKVLYPVLRTWPVASKSAESLLFSREGEDIIYLNELRHAGNKGLIFKLPLNTTGLPAAMGLQGIRQTIDGTDYRGVQVIAAMNKIPESPWYLVSKMDRSEISEEVKKEGRMIFMVITLLLLTTGLLIGFLWRNQRLKFYKSRYEAEIERLALVKHYDYILKFANDIILLFDNNYQVVEANDKAIETYGYSRHEMIGMSLKILKAGDDPQSLDEDLKELNSKGYSTFETVHRKKDGSVFPIEISARLFEIEGIGYYQSISRDITERKQAEETLRESEEKFRKLFEESPVGLAMTGKDTAIIKVNQGFCKMTGYSEEEVTGMTFRELTHPDHIGADEVGVLLLVARKTPVYHTEKKYIRKNGTIIWGSTTIVVIRNSKGEAQFYFAMVVDITAKKRAEEELEKSVSLLEATLESTADGILVVDTDSRIVRFNSKFANMWRIPEEILEKMDDELALKYVRGQLKDPETFLKNVRDLYSSPDQITSDIIEFTDGRVFDRYSQPQKIGGRIVGRVWSFRDITERERARAELIAARDKAQESDRLKTAFLHNVSHEIRTPMNAILGFSNLINEPGVSPEERKQFTDVICQSGNQLLSIINDIVDLASIESGQMKVSIKQININTTLRRLAEQFSYREKPHSITLSLQTPLPQKEAEIMTDGTKLIQVVSNLINNAFKFTQKGKIVFGYRLTEGYVEFFVKDTGIGIPAEHQPKIFDRFYQVDSAVSRQYGGTGLGLSISRAYVELLGGKIWLESEPGRGTVFYFTIPHVREKRKK
ncbi:MAG: PAS domain S-box protein [Bacteroidales bacterium]|nr:PAS domain S-box protein [Bacteroidales bacterium]MBN2632888.1 PAS domain S-box protein [Bacteroidales bacterium]